MPEISKIEGLHSLVQRKRIGLPCGYGWTIFGWSEFGDWNEKAAVYQNRHRRLVYVTATVKKYGDVYTCKMKPCWPRNPKTENQLICQANFAQKVAAWHNLTESEKIWYNKKAIGKGMSGFNLFLKTQLKS